MALIKRDRAGQAAMPDGTIYDWKADETLEVDDRHAQDLLHIADGGFSEVLPEVTEPAPEGEKKAPAKKGAPKKDAAPKTEADEKAEVTEPAPEGETQVEE